MVTRYRFGKPGNLIHPLDLLVFTERREMADLAREKQRGSHHAIPGNLQFVSQSECRCAYSTAHAFCLARGYHSALCLPKIPCALPCKELRHLGKLGLHLGSPSGRAFVAAYYRVGPYLARYLERMPLLKLPLRWALDVLARCYGRR